MGSKIDLTGKRFGRLVALSYVGGNGFRYLCLCDCGKEKLVRGDDLRRSRSKSCGCLQIEMVKKNKTTHGMSKTSEYRIWAAVMTRCYNKRSKSYNDYGGRGIQVCDRWLESFENFLEDMGKRPSSKHSIERNDSNGNYEPSNCRWATQIEQANNKRTSLRININGEIMTAKEAAKLTGISYNTIQHRLSKGYSDIEAIAQTRQSNKKKN
jgi:hypothetical protein